MIATNSIDQDREAGGFGVQAQFVGGLADLETVPSRSRLCGDLLRRSGQSVSLTWPGVANYDSQKTAGRGYGFT
jgi:hypothetical protein